MFNLLIIKTLQNIRWKDRINAENNTEIGVYLQRLLIFLMLLTGITTIHGQQLDQIGKKDGIKVSGGVSADQVYRENSYSGGSPWSTVATGRLSTSVYGLSIPLSFTWSNENWTYTQPFNQFSLSPSYKWATLHLGWSSMSFSPYGLSGHSFAGVGVEVSPGDKFSMSVMHGRLQKALAGDTIKGYDPAYRRKGTGIKGAFNFDRGEVSLSVFYGLDDTHKPVENIDSLGITPKENIVLTSHVNYRITDNLTVNADLGLSSLSDDRRYSRATERGGIATSRYHAVKTSLNYNTAIGSLGGTVEYVEPGYESLGAYYMVNDFIHYTINVATSLFRGRVTAAASGGIRQNNLDKKSDSDTRDVVTNVTLGFSPSERLSFNLTYSNFANYTHVQTLFDEVEAQTQYELMDTLRFTQISENAGLSANWNISQSESQSQSLMLNLNVQQASQSQTDEPENTNTTFISASSGYQWSVKPRNLSLGLNANYSRNETPDQVGEIMGPVLTVRKSFFEKTLQSSFSASWNSTYTDGNASGNVLSTRLGESYTLKKKHRFALSGTYNYRHRESGDKQYYTISLRCSYSF
jgi:hypothetical protein